MNVLRKKDSKGYVLVSFPDGLLEPWVGGTAPNGDRHKFVHEHRAATCWQYGVTSVNALKDKFGINSELSLTVRHVNGNKQDNYPRNLVVLSHRAQYAMHLRQDRRG